MGEITCILLWMQYTSIEVHILAVGRCALKFIVPLSITGERICGNQDSELMTKE